VFCAISETLPWSAAATVASDEEATRPAQIIRRAGKTYTQNVLRDPKKKPRTSWVWKYGWEMEETPTSAGSDRKKIKWVCKVCCESKGFTSYDSDSTTHHITHLRNVHSLASNESCKQGLTVLEMQRHAPGKTTDRQLSDQDRTTLLRSKFEAALIAFIVCCQQSFSVVENSYFQAMLTTSSDLIGRPHFLPTSHNTIASYMKDTFGEKKRH
jgi:hypothetical protein